MKSEMRHELDALMGTAGLDRESAGHPADRSKLREFFIRWYEKGQTLSVADWEAYLQGREWSHDDIREVAELPGDVAIVARHFAG